MAIFEAMQNATKKVVNWIVDFSGLLSAGAPVQRKEVRMKIIATIQLSNGTVSVFYCTSTVIARAFSTSFIELCGIGADFFVMRITGDRYATYDFQCQKLGDTWRSGVVFLNAIGPAFTLKSDGNYSRIYPYDRYCKEVKQ